MKNKKDTLEQLNQVEELFLELAACFAHEKKAELLKVPDCLNELAGLAAVHKLSPAVFEVLRTSLPQELLAENALWKTWKSSVIREVLFQSQRTQGFLEIYRRLTEAGLKPLIVKGMVCRSLYENPDYRISADEDVLVSAEEAAVCDKILLEQGYRRGTLDLENLPHEIAYRNPSNGVYLELHFSLFDETSDVFGGLNEAFQSAFEDAVTMKIQGTDIWTLNPSQHFLYLLCHCYKHFLHSGFGIRQVLDIVLMAEKWGSDMDWQHVTSHILEYQMDRFFAGLLQIGTGWLHMDDSVYAYMGQKTPSITEAREHVQDLLLDILKAGIYGSSTRERQHSANVTLAAAKKENAVLRALFPSSQYLKSRYPFAEKYPVLLPAAWGMRIGRYLSEKTKAKSSQADEVQTEAGSGLEIGKKRVELLHKYGLIE